MLDFVETRPQLLSQGVFTVAGEHMIEVRLDGGSQSAVIPRPQFADACLPRFGGHRQDVVGLFEVKGKTDGVPALLELSGKLGARRIFEDVQVRKILPQESQAKRDRPWHTETPAKIPRRIFAKIIVEAGVAATRRQQNSRQSFLPCATHHRSGLGRGQDSSTALAPSARREPWARGDNGTIRALLPFPRKLHRSWIRCETATIDRGCQLASRRLPETIPSALRLVLMTYGPDGV